MDRDPVEALAKAAADGVEFDGLSARLDGERLHVATEGSTTTVAADGTLADLPAPLAASVTNWFYWDAIAPEQSAGRAFLRWLEGASEGEQSTVPERYDALETGVSREWGQLLLTARLADQGTRRYEVRHVDDQDVPISELAVKTALDDATAIARRDDRDRYRPLKTAPTLPRGWVFPDLDPDAVLSIVGELYPATIENWYREREGDLDVTHYREAAQRQTGRYQSVSELPSEALQWAAEACCVDPECLKRREWDETEDEVLDVPRGDGSFPCREPCSLFVAAAKEWTSLEDEATRTYEIELTPSERDQLEAIVEAVAGGQTDQIREADLGAGANRYRARYLRAKRFEGDASGAFEMADGSDPSEEHTTE
ncbi:DR2241 family protein [Halorhabdus sp. CUG00001]|uniref:DR2241 family protein n=1 Tax=Halorhabdus sp. CUG00001 TaxID=2600297 RepID=UPI00131B9F22|nr:DR2241 family protein [Halorhabdus sp. CUG00001]